MNEESLNIDDFGIGNAKISEIKKLEPALYLVPTPIGNIDDITIRAVKVLSSANIIACEDTRNSIKLLKMLNIHYEKLISYHEYNERDRAVELIRAIENGKSVAIISDAGSPGISDPGFRVINEAIKSNIKIIPLPGANAILPAILGSGFALNEFVFLGFPPQKKGRKTFLLNASQITKTLIIYESTHRIGKLIKEIIEYFGSETEICIAREISKKFEEFIRGTAIEIYDIYEQRKEFKGEIVVVINKRED